MKSLAVVTGGTRGIGLAVSRILFGAGHHVAAIYRENAEAAAQSRAKLSGGPGEFSAHRVDLTDAAACARLADELTEAHGVPAVLVNNAGSIPYPAHWRQQPIELAQRTIVGNLLLTMNVTWAFAPAMAAAGQGNIVNLSSTYAHLGDAEVLAYTAAKAGIHALTLGLARDLGPDGVRVNTVSPSVVITDMTLAAGDEFIEQSAKRTPVGRLATVEDIARAVRFLVDSPMVNGVDLVVDGGLCLTGP